MPHFKVGLGLCQFLIRDW